MVNLHDDGHGMRHGFTGELCGSSYMAPRMELGLELGSVVAGRAGLTLLASEYITLHDQEGVGIVRSPRWRIAEYESSG